MINSDSLSDSLNENYNADIEDNTIGMITKSNPNSLPYILSYSVGCGIALVGGYSPTVASLSGICHVIAAYIFIEDYPKKNIYFLY